jgi:cell division protein ZapE
MFGFLSKQAKSPTTHIKPTDGLLFRAYQEKVNLNQIQYDNDQIRVLSSFQQLINSLTDLLNTASPTFVNPLTLMTKAQQTSRCIYLFGDVGRGKSMLMDLFFDACPVDKKRRVHFHAFMQEVHEYTHQWRKENKGDPLPSLAKNIKNNALVLCFDEFHVTDIVDAMLLSRLFSELLKQGIIFVATSNQHPDDLYKNGFQRELFLPFINLLKESVEIIELIAKEDYRLSYFKSIKNTFYIKVADTDTDFLQQRFNELTNNGNAEAKILSVKGRETQFLKTSGDILYSSFNELCARNLGSADYLEVSCEFTIVLIADIPRLSLEIKDQVRRFITLIDILYEQKIKLFCTLDVPVEELYLEDVGFNFDRTRSRLTEMQSERYFSMDKNKV